MALLKQIKGSTLVETLVASVIIVIVFMIASMSLNNIFKGTLKNNDLRLDNRTSELIYLINNDKVSLPFYEATKDWEISIEKDDGKLIMEMHNKLSSNRLIEVIGYED